MSLTASATSIDRTLNRVCVEGTIAYSGSYPTNGDTLDLSALGVPSDQLPIQVDIYEATTAANKPAYGALYVYLPGTTQANGVMEMFNGTTQISTATYASIFGSVTVVLKFRAWFPALL